MTIETTRINNDVNGNPRFVVHYLDLLTKDELESSFLTWIGAKYDIALQRAKTIGGKKYHNKSYGGGVVFQTYKSTLDADIALAFEKFKQSKDYDNAERNIELVVMNSYNEYKTCLGAMQALIYGEQKDYRKTWSTVLGVCQDTADKLRKEHNIRMTANAVWLGALLVAMEMERIAKENNSRVANP